MPTEHDTFTRQIRERLDCYEAAIRKVTAEHGFAIAESRQLVRRAIDAGETIMVADGIHPNHQGQALIARALLDALGQTEVKLPNTF